VSRLASSRIARVHGSAPLADACADRLRRLGFDVLDAAGDAIEDAADRPPPSVVIECPGSATTVEGALADSVAEPLRRIRQHPPIGPDAAVVIVGLADGAGASAPVKIAAAARARLLPVLVDELGGAGVRVVLVDPGSASDSASGSVSGGSASGGSASGGSASGGSASGGSADPLAHATTVAAVVAWLLDPSDSSDGPPITMLDGRVIDARAVAAEYGLT
jgi:hypothetical protein